MNYWKSVASVLTGTVIAQVIPVVGSLVIARLFAPSDFGVFSAWLGVAMLVGVLLTCRFDMALAIEEDGEPRQRAVWAVIIAVMIITTIVTICLLAVYLWLPHLLSNYSTDLIMTLIPMALLFAASNLWQLWAAAEGEYYKLNYMRIVQAALVTLFQIAAGMLLNSAVALAISQLLGVLFAFVFSVWLMPLGKPKFRNFKAKIFAFWFRHRNFPMFSLPADFISTAAAQLPVLIVASRFGADNAGLLAMTMKVLGAPIGLLGKSVLDVFRRHAAQSYRNRGECKEEYLRTLKVLTLGSAVFCLFMMFASEPLFVIGFGEEWTGAGTIAVWLLPLFALRFIASPLSYMVYIAEKQHLDLLWQCSLLSMTLFTLGLLFNFEKALLVYSFGYSALYLAYLAMSYRFSLGVKS
ncbi:lipopolysaccharide biosynthesis protein [Endozoicomonas acroporae]|uniref:lipopolysaccharide biosynthesis protein n=1 Tax=Endozoicomonas acroporae TaxID=1701104 RepID=UPI003D7B12F6